MRGLEGKYKDVVILSNNVLGYLSNISPTAKADIEDSLAGLTSNYKM